jgi:hypothetical protein
MRPLRWLGTTRVGKGARDLLAWGNEKLDRAARAMGVIAGGVTRDAAGKQDEDALRQKQAEYQAFQGDSPADQVGRRRAATNVGHDFVDTAADINQKITEETTRQALPLVTGMAVSKGAEGLSALLEDTAAARRAAGGIAVGGETLPKVEGRWLRGTAGNAGRIPPQIAEQLRGQQFKSLDAFREQFWRTVAADENLASQFSTANQSRMREGLAPIAMKSQQLGEQTSYILHHVQPIQQGGGVVDLDNLVVVTPRYHKEILEPGYHY